MAGRPMSRNKPLILTILDGWGFSPVIEGNAIAHLIGGDHVQLLALELVSPVGRKYSSIREVRKKGSLYGLVPSERQVVFAWLVVAQLFSGDLKST